MYSVFNSFPTQNKLVTQENENNLTSRKRGVTNSARKPFFDVKLNELKQQNEEKQFSCEKKPNEKNSPIEKKQLESDDYFEDYCSYKDVPDNYTDIYEPGMLIGKKYLDDLDEFIRKHIPNTPPLHVFDLSEPKFVEVPEISSFDTFDDYDVMIPTLDSDNELEDVPLLY